MCVDIFSLLFSRVRELEEELQETKRSTKVTCLERVSKFRI